MNESRVVHLVERAVERMASLGGGAALASPPPVPLPVPLPAPLPAPPPVPPLRPAAPVPAVAIPAVALPAAAVPTRPTDRPVAEPAAPPVIAPIAASGAGSTAVAEPISMAALEAAGMAVAGARRSQIAEEWRVTSGQLLRTMHALRPGSAIGQSPGGHPGISSASQANAGHRDRRDSAAPNLLMVTSSKPNEGKSFSSLNLAGSLALGGLADVLLMDIDSKPGALTELLGLRDRPGLFDLVANPALRPEDMIVATAIAGLSILPIGRVAAGGPGSSERTVTRPVAAMVESLARHFAKRVVVLDSAPCLATSDASTLAPSVGQIAMIVEAERTQRDDLEAALELLRPCPNITLILNKVRLVTTHAFGDYHYYDA